MKKKLVSCILVVCMLLTMLPTMAWATEPVATDSNLTPVATPSDVTLNIANGSIVITATGYKQGDAADETAYTGDYVISQTDAATATAYTITVDGIADGKTITLAGVNIESSTAQISPIRANATVTIQLLGENKIKYTAAQNSALHIAKDATVTLCVPAGMQDDDGSLTAEVTGRYTSAIGAGDRGVAGYLVINSGTITAKRAANTSKEGTSIGAIRPNGIHIMQGITVNGGILNATSVNGNAMGLDAKEDNIAPITITGGYVYSNTGFSSNLTYTGGNIKADAGKEPTIDGKTMTKLYVVDANGVAQKNELVSVTVNSNTWKTYTDNDGIITTYLAESDAIADAQKLPDGWLIGGTCVCATAPLTFEDTVDTVDVYSAEKTIDVVVRGECNMPIHKSVTTTVKIESVTIEGSTTPVVNADTYATYADGKLTLKPAGNEKNYTVKLSATRGGASEVPVTYEIKALASNTGRVLDIAKGAITVEAASEAGEVTYKQGDNEFTVAAADKVTISGSSSANNIEVSTDATIVLKDLSLTDITAKSPIKLTNNATLNLWLEGENTLTTGVYNHNDAESKRNGVTTSAIFVESGSTLVIDSEAGTLKNADIDAAHGGDKQDAYAGSLHAETAGDNHDGASAIGGDFFASPDMACGNITIKGGNVTAIVHGAGNKYRAGAAIGAGWNNELYTEVDTNDDGEKDTLQKSETYPACGDITITGGNVRAEALIGPNHAGRAISSGMSDLTITGGVVYATAPNDGVNGDSRGSIYSYGGTITIGAVSGDDDDVYVYATTSTRGSDSNHGQVAIGGGNGVNIVINSGTVYAESTGNGAAIGGGVGDVNDNFGKVEGKDGKVGSITINGGNVTTVDASGVGDSQAVGIGVSGVSGSACGPIVINGGTVTCENSSIGTRGYERDTTPISVTVGSDATITVENDTSGLTTLTAEGGATINGDTLPESVDSVAIPAGKLGEVKVDETKGTITLPAGSTVNGVTLPESMDSVTVPADKLDEVKVNSNGAVSLPAGSSVTDADGETTNLTIGGTVAEDGTVKHNSYGYYIPTTTPTVTPSVDSSSLNNAAQAVGNAINSGNAEMKPASGYTKEDIAKLQKEGKLNLTIEKKSGYASVADKNLIDAAIAKAGGAVSGTVVMYFDITPVLKTDDGKVVADVTDTEKPIAITIDLSADLQKAAKDGKHIAVVRCHDGKTTFLDAKLNAAKTQVTFSSADFSTYAVVAMEKQTSAQTFDAGIMVYGAMAVLAATGSAVVIGKKRK